MKRFDVKIFLMVLSLLAVLLFLTGCISAEENLKTELDQLADEELNAVVEESGTENEAVAGMALYNKYAQKNVLNIAKSVQQAKETCLDWVCDELGKKKICKETGYYINCGAGKECIGGTCIPALANPCGNGYINPNEDCEDGNHVNNDGCSISCQFEVCGDGIIQTNSWPSYKLGKVIVPEHKGEFCDDGADNDKPNKCNKECSGITAPICGNGAIESGEVCDDGNANKGDGCYKCKIESGWECEKNVCEACAVPLNGLVHWWPADGNAEDLKGGKHGNLGSGTTFSSGKLGKAFNFNYVQNGYVYVQDADNLGIYSSLNLGNNKNGFSVEAWVKLFAEGKILSKMGSADNPNLISGYELSISNSGRFKMALTSLLGSAYGQKLETSTIPGGYNNGEWHHLVVVFQPPEVAGEYCPSPTIETLAIYVNGELKSDKPEGASCLDIKNTVALYIGPGTGGDSASFKGQIDEIGFYNHALSEKEISGLYEAGMEGKKRCKN